MCETLKPLFHHAVCGNMAQYFALISFIFVVLNQTVFVFLFFFNSIYTKVVNADITCEPGCFGVFPCFKYKMISNPLIFSCFKKDQLHYDSVFLQMDPHAFVLLIIIVRILLTKKNISKLLLLWVVSLFIYVALINPLKLLSIFQTSVRRSYYLL